MKKRLSTHSNNEGFTLVELMVTMVVAFLVIGAVYSSFKVQQRSHKAQIQVTEIQQNIRAAMHMISRELRIAGYDPDYTGNYGITAANLTLIAFTGDLCEEADPPNTPHAAVTPIIPCGASSPYAGQLLPETYTYQHFDSNGDTYPDQILRTVGAAGEVIAENIERLDFRYILDTGVELPLLPPGQFTNVSAIKISILARASEPDYNYLDQNTYPYASGLTWDPSTFPSASCNNDNCLNYRRRSLVETLEFRNIGL